VLLVGGAAAIHHSLFTNHVWPWRMWMGLASLITNNE
jgi:hypothetical protein